MELVSDNLKERDCLEDVGIDERISKMNLNFYRLCVIAYVQSSWQCVALPYR
jgi:hypothetical protein